MPAGFELCENERIVYSRAWGDVTEADLTQHMNSVSELFREGTIDATWAQVWDFTTVDSADSLALIGVRNLAKENPWPKESIRALVIASPLVFGFCRMYQILTDLEENRTLTLTKTVAEAEAYIKTKRVERTRP